MNLNLSFFPFLYISSPPHPHYHAPTHTLFFTTRRLYKKNAVREGWKKRGGMYFAKSTGWGFRMFRDHSYRYLLYDGSDFFRRNRNEKIFFETKSNFHRRSNSSNLKWSRGNCDSVLCLYWYHCFVLFMNCDSVLCLYWYHCFVMFMNCDSVLCLYWYHCFVLFMNCDSV